MNEQAADPKEPGTGPFSDGAYRAVFEQAPDGILIVDEAGRIAEANGQAAGMFGYGREELLGREVELLVPAELGGSHREMRTSYAAHPRPRPMGVGMELRGRRKDGSEFPVEISLSPLGTPAGEYFISTIRDLSGLERFRSHYAQVLRAMEGERLRVAQELHDDTAQKLAALLLRVGLIRRSRDEEARDALLEDLKTDIEVTEEAVRRIARGLRPPRLDDGLLPAVRAHVETFLSDAEIDVEIEADAETYPLSGDARLAAYRIIQECLSNVVRHAGASRVRIRLAASDGAMTASVEDDGKGFDVSEAAESGGGLGLLGMNERAYVVGGRVAIESRPGAGTRVRIHIPLRPNGHGE